MMEYCLCDGIPIPTQGTEGAISSHLFDDKAIIIFDKNSQRIGIAKTSEKMK